MTGRLSVECGEVKSGAGRVACTKSRGGIGVDVGGREDGLVAIAVVTAVGVGSAGHVAAATGSTVAVVVH